MSAIPGAGSGRVLDRRHFAAAKAIIRKDPRLRGIEPSAYRHLVKEQSRLLYAGRRMAVQGLVSPPPTAEDRREAMRVARSIGWAGKELAAGEGAVLAEIRGGLGVGTAG